MSHSAPVDHRNYMIVQFARTDSRLLDTYQLNHLLDFWRALHLRSKQGLLETCKAEIKRQTDGGLWHFVVAFFLLTSCPAQYQDVRNSLSQQANATYTFNQTILTLTLEFLAASAISDAISKPNRLANLTALNSLNGSSRKVWSGSSGVLRILLFRS